MGIGVKVMVNDNAVGFSSCHSSLHLLQTRKSVKVEAEYKVCFVNDACCYCFVTCIELNEVRIGQPAQKVGEGIRQYYGYLFAKRLEVFCPT